MLETAAGMGAFILEIHTNAGQSGKRQPVKRRGLGLMLECVQPRQPIALPGTLRASIGFDRCVVRCGYCRMGERWHGGSRDGIEETMMPLSVALLTKHSLPK